MNDSFLYDRVEPDNSSNSEEQIEAAYKHQLLKYTVVPLPRPDIINDLTPEQIEAA